MKGTRVFITGGARGLGRSLAAALADEGARVLIGDVDESAAEETAVELGVASLGCDVRQVDDAAAAARWVGEHWGGIDLLINNAGVAHMGSLEKASIEDWQWIVDINLLGIVRTTQAFLPQLRDARGRILNIASMSGLLFLPGAAAYNATKAGVVALSEGLMLELEPDGIGVHVACPAFFRTDLARGMRASDEEAAQTTRRLVERARSGPDEIAHSILTGLSRGDRYIFTHAKSRRTWLLKRFMPFNAYLALLRSQLQKLDRRLRRPESST